MADYSKFKNANGDDLVLQDSRVDDISEKVEGIEAGAEVNKIESISIDNTKLVPDVNKNVNIAIKSYCGLSVNNNNELSFNVNTSNASPLYIGDGNDLSIYYDKATLTMVHSGSDEHYLTVLTPVPTPKSEHVDVGKVLTVQQASDPNNPDEIVWTAPQGGLPSYTQADAGKVLAVKADGSGLEWISLVPANAVGVNNEPVGLNGDYFTVGEGQ